MAEKRPGHQASNESCKRRAPYAARACDACRRRKGRCDGRKPCEYCLVRSLSCSYSLNTEDRRSNSSTSTTGRNSSQKSHKEPQWTHEEISGLVASMQGQLETLVAHVKMSNEGQSLDATHSILTTNRASSNMARAGSDAKTPVKFSRANSSSKRPAQWFHGPTSPDYSLIAAQIRIEEGNLSIGRESGRRRLPCLDDCQSDYDEDEEPNPDTGDEDSTIGRLPAHQDFPPLFTFLGYFSKSEAIRLLRIYHEMVGELHPIRDIDSLLEQTEILYASIDGQGPRGDREVCADEDDLVILNLAFLIAITAEPAPESDMNDIAINLHNSCRAIIDSKVMGPASSINNVLITLLMGFYHFFKFRLRLAWRMCGLAGRMAMELGIHNKEVLQPYPENDGHRQEVATISCSILVLDRQWSAAAGLPPNFQESDFEMAQISLASTPYLKAMMAFTLMCDKFNEPISRVARGGNCQDEDTLEVTNFRVEQWRKRALEKHNFTHPEKWNSAPATKSPAWTIILYLRANAVRGILLRPFFLSTSNLLAKKKIQRGLEIVSDSMTILSILDRETDIFKKQHPHLQHFLASACALLFLIVSYTEQNRTSIPQSFLKNYPDSVKRSFGQAWRLSVAYSKSSRASHRLCKRLLSMREPLIHWGLISREEDFGINTSHSSFPHNINVLGNSNKNTDASEKVSVWKPMANALDASGDDFSFLDMTYNTAAAFSDPLANLSFANSNNGSQVECFDPLLFEYSMNSSATFFSDGGC